MTDFAKKIEQSFLKLCAMWKCDASIKDVRINDHEASIACLINSKPFVFNYHTDAKGVVWFRT